MSWNVEVDRVTTYAREVAAGRVVCGELHRLACERHLRDLERSKSDDFPYVWDVGASQRIIGFAETLTIAEGSEPKPVRLIPSQSFDIGCTFGWIKKSNGKRRFRRRYKSVARQNGKTFENAIMGAYIAGFSGYKLGKLFTVATKTRQSRLAWEGIKNFINADPDLKEFFKVQDYASKIQCLPTGCTIEALSQESGLDDGFRAIFSSVDEIHQHKDNKIYKSQYNGQRSLDEALISMITTRGDRLNSFCKEMDDYCVKILRGLATAEDFFVDIYCLDKDDDIWNEGNWQKANPFYCLSGERMEQMRNDARTAREMGGSDLRDFIIKCLNMWVVNIDTQYIRPDDWKACGSARGLAEIVAAGYRRCWAGLDLSSGGDLTTLTLEFETEPGCYYWWSHSFMPRGRLEEHVETDLAPYDLWVEQGRITVTGGSDDFMTDYKFILSYMAEIRDEYGLEYLGIGYDPHNAAGILQDLEGFGCPLIMITQSARNLNDATVEVRLLIKSGRLEHDEADELLTWSMINAATVQNSFGEIKIDKKPHERYKRIDPIDAGIDAHAGRLLSSKAEEADVEDEVAKGLEAYLAALGGEE